MTRSPHRLLGLALAVPLSLGASAAPAQSPEPYPLGTELALIWMAGEAIAPDAGITITFASDASLAGFGGCNSYSATWRSDGTILSVDPIRATLKACDPSRDALESRYLDLLQASASWSLSGSSVEVVTSDGSTLAFGGGPDGDSTGAQTSKARSGSTRSAGVSTVVQEDEHPSGEPVMGVLPGPDVVINKGSLPPPRPAPDAIVGDPPFKPSELGPPSAQGFAPAAPDDPSPSDLVFTEEPVVVARAQGGPGGVLFHAEPIVATKGQRMMVTWNFYAAQSFDGGATFSYLDPAEPFPAEGFCCDQLVYYLPAQDLWVWVRQSWLAADRTNLQRISVARGDAAFDAATFRDYDFRAQDFELGDAVMLDQPRVGWSDEYLYLTSNAYEPVTTEDYEYVGVAVWRIPLAGLAAGSEEIEWQWFTTSGSPGYLAEGGYALDSVAPVRDAGTTMYLASHFDTSTLAVWAWPDDSDAYTYQTATTVDGAGRKVGYRARQDGEQFACPRDGATDATSDWCSTKLDERMTTGWRRGDAVGWAWAVPQTEQRPFPGVWAVEVDTARLGACDRGECIASWMQFRLEDTAAAFPVLAANARGDLGGVVLVGGGAYPPMCVAISRSFDAPDDDPWKLLIVATSDVDAWEPRWGDYLGITTDSTDDLAWTATCMSLHAGLETAVHVARFTQRGDLP